MKKILLLLLLIPTLIYAQEKGVHFEHNLSWTEIKAKAKAENKFIFMDCFTTWCGPCRYMSSTIFPTEEAGNFMNDKFINVEVQLDTTANDDAEVKSWYQDGHDIAATYNVRAYPTYLIFDANGNVVHRFVGSTQTAAEFVEKAKNALNPETQYYVLLKQYKEGKNDSAFLHKMATAAMNAYDMTNAPVIVDKYLATQNDLFTKDNLIMIATFTKSSKDKGFSVMMNNPEKVDAVLGEGVAENITTQIIMQEEIFSAQSQGANGKPDWSLIASNVSKKYPANADEIVAKGKVFYYRSKNDWNDFQFAVVDYMKKYGAKASPNELNSYAWTVFQNCKDMTCVSEALEWSKRSFKDNNEPAFMDTYANILYKLGKKDEAITWEQKALDLAPAGDKKNYEETIQKMKNGEKTWN
jgi:thiol-disulfide isomerase/thioredoxin